MITRINLKNWRSHANTTLDFADGTNALIGIMGSGKSSVMDGLCFGLFGTFPALQARKVKIEDMIMKKPKDQKDSEVTIFFDENGQEWSIRRTISKVKATSAELRKGQQLIEGPQPSRVNETLEKLLKVDYDLFTRAIYTEQNQIDMFLTIPKGARMKKIDELLAIDKFEKARATAIALVSKLNNSAESKKSLIQSLEMDSSIRMLPTLQRELEQAEQEKKTIEQKVSLTSGDAQRLQRDVAEMRNKREQNIEITKQLETSIALLGALQTDVDNLRRELTIEEIRYSELSDAEVKEKYEGVAKHEAQLKEQVDGEINQLKNLMQLIGSKNAKIGSFQDEKIPELEEKIKERERLEKLLKKDKPEKLAEELSKLQDALDKTRQQAERAEGQAAQIEESITEMESVEDKCPICDQEITKDKKSHIMKNKKAHITRLKSSIENWDEDSQKLKKQISELEARLENVKTLSIKFADMNELESQIKLAKDAIKVLQREIENHETELRMQEKANKMLEKELDDVRKEAERFRTVIEKREQYLSKLSRVKQLQDSVAILEGKKAALRGFSQAELERLENEHAQTLALMSALRVKWENAVRVADERKVRVAEIETKLKQIEAYKHESAKLEKLSKEFSLLAMALESTQSQLRKNFVNAVNMAMHQIWQNLYPYKDFYSCRLNIDEGDYVLELQDSTGWIPADGIASGGERAMACLALRIAFALVLAPQLRWLVLDEPTHNLDAKAVEDLSTVLRERITEFVDQVFLITHDPALESAVTGYLYKLERDKAKDGPTIITKIAGPDMI